MPSERRGTGRVYVYVRYSKINAYSHRIEQCSFMEYKNYKVVYRRYASLYFIIGVDSSEVRLLQTQPGIANDVVFQRAE